MANSSRGAQSVAVDVSERTPLLGDQQPSQDDGAAAEAQQNGVGDVPLAEEPSLGKLAVIMGSTYVGVFFGAADATVVATLTTPISTEFNSFKLLSWLATAYLIANAGFQPLSGKLTDIYGRRAGLVLSNLLFAAGNLICGFANSETVMIVGRVVAGIGGGCIMSISVMIGSDLIPLRKRGVWQGIGNIAYGTGAGVGGLFGGWMNDTIGWRYAFFLQVPFTVLAAIIVTIMVKIPVKETDKSRIKRVDFPGAITLVIALVLLLLGLNSGGNVVPWNHPLVYVSLPLSAIFLGAFVYIEDQIASEPIMNVRLFANRTVTAACLTNWFSSMAWFAVLYYGPIFFQAQGLSAREAGLRLIPGSIGASVGSLSAGFVMRATGRYYVLNCVGESLFILATALLLGIVTFSSPLWPPFVIFFIGGTAYGGMLTVTLLALISAVEHKFQAVITSASYAFRSTGSTIGISIAGSVFQNIVSSRLWEEFGDRKDAAKIIGEIRDDLGTIKHLHEPWKSRALSSYEDALKGVWVATLILCLLGAVSSLFMREHILHKNLERR